MLENIIKCARGGKGGMFSYEHISHDIRLVKRPTVKMRWLSELVRLLVEKVFGLSVSERIGGSIHFFIYDTIKIFILLSLLIFVISYIQSYFPPERTKKILGKIKGIKGNILWGALLGTITPFCSCSSIPILSVSHRLACL